MDGVKKEESNLKDAPHDQQHLSTNCQKCLVTSPELALSAAAACSWILFSWEARLPAILGVSLDNQLSKLRDSLQAMHPQLFISQDSGLT